MLETSSGNALDETEENDFDQRNVGEEEKKIYVKQLLSTRAGKKKKSENLLQSMSTIQSST